MDDFSPETDEFLGLLPSYAVMTLITLKWAPPLVQGLVRDLRARWALEEAGIPYVVMQIGPDEQRATTHLASSRIRLAAKRAMRFSARCKITWPRSRNMMSAPDARRR